MEPVLLSDESCDSEMKLMKSELSEFDLDEENLSKEEMQDLLRALKNSKTTAMEENPVTQKFQESDVSCKAPQKTMKRRYLNVKDRRMPWCLFPSSITPSEKARTLAVYIKLMSINGYRLARQSPHLAAWPPPIQIIEETTRSQPLRSTRSGRSVPTYADLDDDSSDLDFIVTKSKKRKILANDNTNDGVYTNKFISLKRKTTKDDNGRPVKEAKINNEKKNESMSPDNKIKVHIIEEFED